MVTATSANSVGNLRSVDSWPMRAVVESAAGWNHEAGEPLRLLLDELHERCRTLSRLVRAGSSLLRLEPEIEILSRRATLAIELYSRLHEEEEPL